MCCFEEFRQVWGVSIVTMHEGACEEEVSIPSPWGQEWDVLFAQARMHCNNKSRQTCLKYNYNMAFQYCPINIGMLLQCPSSRDMERVARYLRHNFTTMEHVKINQRTSSKVMLLILTAINHGVMCPPPLRVGLTLAICSFIKPTAIEQFVLFPAKI